MGWAVGRLSCTPKEAVAVSDDPQHLAFAILVREHHAGLIAYGQSLYASIGRSQDRDAAEDLVQESLLIAFENLAKYEHDRGFAPWVRGIMRFRFLKKARHREVAVDGEVLNGLSAVYQGWYGAQPPGTGPESEQHPDAMEALHHCLQLLQADQRATVEGFYFQQHTVQKIAEDLSATPSAIKKRLQRSRQQLADCIRKRLLVAGSSTDDLDLGEGKP